VTHAVVDKRIVNLFVFFFRELEFRKGDTIRIIQGIDENWIEGEYNGNIGIFPVSYVEVRLFLHFV